MKRVCTAVLLCLVLLTACAPSGQAPANTPAVTPSPSVEVTPPAPSPEQPAPIPTPPAEPEPSASPEPPAEPSPEPSPEPSVSPRPPTGPEPAPDADPSAEPEPAPEPGPSAEPEPAAPKTVLYVLMLHHMVADGEECNDWTMTVTRFREQLQWLADNGYTTVLPSQLVSGQPLPEKPVLLTFDDGYESNYLLTYPILQEFQAKAVISLIVRRADDGSDGRLTWAMCREMAASGLVEFGSHTWDLHDPDGHGIRRLEGESREEYEARVLPDLERSITLLRDNLGVQPLLFAYPNGVTESWAEDFLRQNFAITLTTQHGTADPDKGWYELRRMNLSMKAGVWDYLPAASDPNTEKEHTT